MNTYIQDKLDEFDKKFTDTEQGNFYSKNTTWKHTIGVPVHVKMFINQALTDYHNHIVEKFKEKYKFSSSTTLFEILSILQDTNLKE